MSLYHRAAFFFAAGWIFNGVVFIVRADMTVYGIFNIVPGVLFLGFYAFAHYAAGEGSKEGK